MDTLQFVCPSIVINQFLLFTRLHVCFELSSSPSYSATFTHHFHTWRAINSKKLRKVSITQNFFYLCKTQDLEAFNSQCGTASLLGPAIAIATRKLAPSKVNDICTSDTRFLRNVTTIKPRFDFIFARRSRFVI